MRRRAAAVLAVLLAVGLAGQAGAGVYRVRRGDTLGRIARRHGTTVDQLARVNGIRNVNLVRAGQVLRITPGGSVAPTSPRLPTALRGAPDRLALSAHFDDAARRYGVPADLLKALAWLESGWQNDKVSPAGATGIGQLMPATVEFVNDALLPAALDPARPEQNIRMTARFLRYLLDATGGDPAQALAAYYQGLRSLRETGPKPVSKPYTEAVLALRARFR